MANTELTPFLADNAPNYDWVAEKVQPCFPETLIHVRRQAEGLKLTENDGFLDVLMVSIRAQLEVVARTGEFAFLTDDELPVEGESTAVMLPSDGVYVDGMRYAVWETEKAKAAAPLVAKAETALRELPFNAFWNARAWERLKSSNSSEVLRYDGVDLLMAVLGKDAVGVSREVLVAQALAKRFAHEIVKADFTPEFSPGSATNPGDFFSEQLEILKGILGQFTAEIWSSPFIRCDLQNLPISSGWVVRLARQIQEGQGEPLLRDLGALRVGDYDAMASVLATYFPTIVIQGLQAPSSTR